MLQFQTNVGEACDPCKELRTASQPPLFSQLRTRSSTLPALPPGSHEKQHTAARPNLPHSLARLRAARHTAVPLMHASRLQGDRLAASTGRLGARCERNVGQDVTSEVMLSQGLPSRTVQKLLWMRRYPTWNLEAGGEGRLARNAWTPETNNRAKRHAMAQPDLELLGLLASTAPLPAPLCTLSQRTAVFSATVQGVWTAHRHCTSPAPKASAPSNTLASPLFWPLCAAWARKSPQTNTDARTQNHAVRKTILCFHTTTERQHPGRPHGPDAAPKERRGGH